MSDLLTIAAQVREIDRLNLKIDSLRTKRTLANADYAELLADFTALGGVR